MIVITDRFLNRYRIPSARAAWWNYAGTGIYFITICTARREHLFGKIKNQEIHLSPIGEIVQQEWEKSFEIRNQLFCDAFVIMPTHHPNNHNPKIKIVAWRIVRQNRYHHLLLVLNRPRQNESMNFGIPPKHRFGKPVFMTISSAMRLNTKISVITLKIILPTGKKINYSNEENNE